MKSIKQYQDCDVFLFKNDVEWYGYDKNTTLGQMIDKAVEHKCCVIVKNGGGKWYLKGQGKVFNEVKEKVERNLGKYKRVKVWLIEF